jgi:hypothetical protein
MTVGLHLTDIESQFRSEADDWRAPLLWSSSEVLFWANEAQIEACRRSRLLKDSTTAAITTYTLAQNAQFITLDPRVIYVRQCHILSSNLPRVRKHKQDLDLMFPGWDYPVPTTAGGSVVYWCPDRDYKQIWFNCPSPLADTVQLTVVRIPQSDMAAIGTFTQSAMVNGVPGLTTNTVTASVDPEIDPMYHAKLVHWILYRAYGKQDAETNDPEKSKNALAQFEAEFGPAVPALNQMYTEEQYMYDDHDGAY